jgi:hypothetical protein
LVWAEAGWQALGGTELSGNGIATRSATFAPTPSSARAAGAEIRQAAINAAGARLRVRCHDLMWGVTANNNPTVQDVWNTVPARSFPFISSAVAPTLSASTFIEQVYAQQVVGVSACSFLDDMFYFEVGGYRPLSTNMQLALGVDTTGQSPISGVAPYWRVAFETEFWRSFVGSRHIWACVKSCPAADVWCWHGFLHRHWRLIANFARLGDSTRCPRSIQNGHRWNAVPNRAPPGTDTVGRATVLEIIGARCQGIIGGAS